MRVLVVEDDLVIAGFLKKGLSEEGYLADVAGTAPEAIDYLAAVDYDLIVLDLLLPGGSGVDVCRGIRERGVNTPVIMLTAKDTVEDRIMGLDAGADDYLVKPFSFGELLARLRALLRRERTIAASDLQVGGLTLDPLTRRVERDGRHMELTPKEFSLLEYMMRHPGQALSRTQLADQIWGYNFSYDSNVIDVYIRYLRKKIDHDFDAPLIHTVRGSGYKIEARTLMGDPD